MATTVGELLVVIEARTAQFNSQLAAVERRLVGLDRSAGKGTQAIATGFRAAASAALAFAAAVGVREILQLSDRATLLANSLALVTDSETELIAVQEELFRISNRTGSSLDSNAETFRRIALAAQDTTLSTRELLGVTETLNQLTRISGATSQEASAGLIQFSQALASGRFQGDELRSVLEGLPAVGRALADGLGVPFTQLRTKLQELNASGADVSEILLRALQSQADEVERSFSQLGVTFGEVFTVLGNAVTQAASDVQRSLQFGGPATREGLVELGTALREGLVDTLAGVLSLGADVLRFVAELVDALENVGLTSDTLSLAFTLVLETIQGTFQALLIVVRSLLAVVNITVAAIQALQGNFAKADEAFADFSDNIAGIGTAADSIGASFDRAATAVTETARANGQAPNTTLSDGIRAGADAADKSVTKLRSNLADLATSRGIAAELDAAGGGAKGTKALTDDQIKANEKLNDLAEKIAQERLKSIDPLLAELAAVDRQIEATRELAAEATDKVAAEAAVNGLLEEQFQLRERLKAAREGIEPAETALQEAIRNVSLIDADAARRITEDVSEALAKAEGSEERLKAVQDAAKRAGDFLEEEARNSRLGEALGDSLSVGISEALRGSVEDFAPAFGAALRDSALDNLGQAFTSLIQDQLGPALANAFGVGGAVGNGLLAVGGALISGLFGGDQIDSAASSVRSAVTSTQQTRGIVAGPTGIAVAEVGRSIKEAFTESERFLRLIERNTRATAEAVGGAVAGTAGPGLASGVLAFESESTL